jgi:hypothetical protein
VTVEREAREGAFTEPDVGCDGAGGGDEKRTEEDAEVGVVTDEQEIFAYGAIVEEFLEVPERRGGGKRGGVQDLRFVAGLSAYERGSLEAALEGT